MKENWKKIVIFVGLVILQIGLAYGLVTYILPPARVNNFASSDNNKDDKNNTATISSAEKTSVNNNLTEPLQDVKKDTLLNRAVADSDSVNVSVMIDGMSDYLEDQLLEKDMKDAYTFAIEEIIVNPAQTRGTRYVVISLSVIVKGKNVEGRLDAKMPAIKDAINTLISRKTVLWLSDIDNRPFLREEIKILLESIIGDVKVLRLYFTKYIFQ